MKRKTTTPAGTTIELKPAAGGGNHVVVNRPQRPTWISNTRPAAGAAKEFWRISKAVTRKEDSNG